MENEFFFTQPTPGGYRRTLASRTAAILREIESKYGTRDEEYTLVGVEFEPTGPRIWYPGSGKHIAIQLSTSAQDYWLQAEYQLAHECVHLLAPSGGANAPVMEEGLATLFANDWLRREHNFPYTPTDARYASVLEAVEQLLKLYPDAITLLRSVERAFFKMSVETFDRAGLKNVLPDLRERLVTPFREYMVA
ncbi:hypothetical protein AWB74_06337 [Caballeronia arvi]|uniref:Uncharacterized protein n=1 Tax=Caballeronia arvi TaxID=1777135 RepID=A0A158KPX0_9BURK|nr:hypothetical protein [Caballeronia arvi]SAL82640.1 hypothetical protein AWB74_06337 [Caballeronia arvi]